MRKSTKILRILKIYQIDGFRVTCIFNTGEYKTIDFNKLLEDVQPGEPKYLLKDSDTFKQVNVNDSQTLAWPNLLVSFPSFEKEGETTQALLDLDPIVLYNAGVPYKNQELLIGNFIREERINAGLTQEELARRSGTTKTYISRLENGKLS